MRHEAVPTWRQLKRWAKYGFLGIPVPKEYGGQGC